MKKLYLSITLLFLSVSIFSQNENNQLYSYKDLSIDIKQILDAPDDYFPLNFTLESVRPLKLSGENHENFRHGISFGMGILIRNDEGGPAGPNFVTANIGYVFGYEYPISKQLSIMPSIKPTLNFVATTDIPGSEDDETLTDFSFSGLLALKARYFFSEESKYGISAEALTSFEGGFGFLIGFSWRTSL